MLWDEKILSEHFVAALRRRSVQRKDGKIITIYYFTSDQIVAQYREATIWDPRIGH